MDYRWLGDGSAFAFDPDMTRLLVFSLLLIACSPAVEPTPVEVIDKREIHAECTLRVGGPNDRILVHLDLEEDAVVARDGREQVVLRLPVRAHLDFSMHAEVATSECLDADQSLPFWLRSALVLGEGADDSALLFGEGPALPRTTVTLCAPLSP
jgi:hypothetical protein